MLPVKCECRLTIVQKGLSAVKTEHEMAQTQPQQTSLEATAMIEQLART